MILGHEAVGEIVEVGNLVKTLKPGDRVIVPAITPDWGSLEAQAGYSMHSGGMLAGWKFSNFKDGVFAEYFHVNEADANLALCRRAWILPRQSCSATWSPLASTVWNWLTFSLATPFAWLALVLWVLWLWPAQLCGARPGSLPLAPARSAQRAPRPMAPQTSSTTGRATSSSRCWIKPTVMA